MKYTHQFFIVEGEADTWCESFINSLPGNVVVMRADKKCDLELCFQSAMLKRTIDEPLVLISDQIKSSTTWLKIIEDLPLNVYVIFKVLRAELLPDTIVSRAYIITSMAEKTISPLVRACLSSSALEFDSFLASYTFCEVEHDDAFAELILQATRVHPHVVPLLMHIASFQTLYSNMLMKWRSAFLIVNDV